MGDIEFKEGFFVEKPCDGKPDWIKAIVDIDLEGAIAPTLGVVSAAKDSTGTDVPFWVRDHHLPGESKACRY